MKLIMSEQEYNEAIQKAEKRGYENGVNAQSLIDRDREKGSWIDHSFETYDEETAYYMECSACHETFSEVDVTVKPMHYNYCPKCGARMKVVE